ncbi:MAG: GNAT family N-acetyltransferase [Terriglobales bacterium]
MPDKAAAAQDTSTVRNATIHDAEKIADLCTQLGYPSTAEQVRQRLQLIAHDNRRCLIVLQTVDDVVGFIDLELREIVVAAPLVEICGLVVDSAVRSKGYGRVLLDAAERWAGSKGAAEVGLRSNILRKEAHSFYERAGYTIYKQQFAFKKKLQTS